MTMIAAIAGQVMPAATVATTLVAATPAQQAPVAGGAGGWQLSQVVVANQNAAADTVSIAHRIGGAALTAAQYLVYKATVTQGTPFVLAGPINLGPTDILTIISLNGTSSFNAYGQQIQ